MKAKRSSIFALLVLPYLLSSAVSMADPAAPFYPIQEKGLWGYIDQNGTVVRKPQFEEAADFAEGLAGVKTDTMWGFVNPSGSVVIAPQFDRIDPFRHSLARVSASGLMAYVNKEGKIVWKAKQ